MITEASTVYFAGIGGIGMSALATLFIADGKEVWGSDIQDSSLIAELEKRGATVHMGQEAENITEQIDLLVYSGALPEDHPERVRAAELDIPTMTYFEAVGEYAQQFEQVVAIAGTHGKTTTTAMLGLMAERAGLNPTVIVGSVVREFGSNARVGSKELLIVEACEHEAHLLHIRPHVAVITNIEADHLDWYRDIDHIRETFQEFVNGVYEGGTVILHGEDENAQKLAMTDKSLITFGSEAGADTLATDTRTQGNAQQFEVADTSYSMQIPGRFNVHNALAAMTAAQVLGVTDSVMQEVLGAFGGVWRRFEILGDYKGATVISDYAHHPTAVGATIQAAKEFFPGKRIIAVFQPHQRARTKKLLAEFVEAFAQNPADTTVIQEIYGVAGREEEEFADVNAHVIIDALQQQNVEALYSPHNDATIELLVDIVEKKDVVLVMGAGDVYHIAEQLAQ